MEPEVIVDVAVTVPPVSMAEQSFKASGRWPRKESNPHFPTKLSVSSTFAIAPRRIGV